MWKLGNRVFIVLVCMLSGCVVLYNIWGSVFGLIITLLLVIYASVLLLANDNLQTPHALLLLQYIQRAGRESYNLLQSISCQTTTYTLKFVEIAKIFYQNHIITRMDRHRRHTYQLSTETLISSNKNTEFSVVGGSTPIARNRRRSYISGSENNSGIDSINSREYDDGARSLDKVTSTPLVQWKKRESSNGDINHRFGDITVDNQTRLKRSSSLYLNDRSLLKDEETVYSPRSSPWGTSISPKMRPRAAGVKTVQTVAGPLLTSTRYNIDPKVYTDVTSPGLTSRLTKYATEANMKLIHQPQYSTGQFPRVNLNASPTPMINTRSPRARTSVTVRVAPPETTKYSPPERQKMLAAMCQTQNTTPPSVAQVLKEISLKRHASRDDITVELAKKQRTDGIFNDELENYEEGTQKRGRDDLSKSEGEISLDNAPMRPSKRTKVPSCYDILNSLSSSTNVSSGIKRKADLSRSGTPDIGKHFKSLDSIQRNRNLSISLQQDNIDQSRNDSIDTKLDESASLKASFHTASPQQISSHTNDSKKNTYENEKKSNSVDASIKITDRLFMRAEPQNIDKLKSLIEEHGKVTSKFSIDDDEEIKKKDVVIMRQTSMKARLQSMFDAISGKISGQIDPNVVIQAEQVNKAAAVTSTSSSPTLMNQQSSSIPTTLNSSTSTTSLIASPISTSAVVPIIGKTKTNTTPGKHVTFMLPNATTTVPTTNAGTVPSTIAQSPKPLTTVNLHQKTDESKKLGIDENSKPLPSLFGTSTAMNPTSIPSCFSLSSNTAVSTTSVSDVNSMPGSLKLSTSSALSTSSNILPSFTSASANPPTGIAFGIPQSTGQQKLPLNTISNFTMAPVKPIVTAASTAGFSFGTPTIIPNVTSNSQTNPTATTQSTPMLGLQTATTSTLAVPMISTSSTNLFAADKPKLFTGTTSISSSTITTPVFSFGQSSLKSTANPTTQGAFSFGSTSNPNEMNSGVITTSHSQISTTPSAVAATTSSAFTFGMNKSNSSTSSLAFGTNNQTNSESVPNIGANNMFVATTTGTAPATTTSSIFSFGTVPAATKPVFSFGASNNPQTTVQNTTLNFGVSSQPTGPSFNNSNNTPTATTTNPQNPLAFGTIFTTTPQSNPTPGNGTMSFTFGAPNQSQTTFPSTTASTTNTNAAVPQFGIAPQSTESSTFGLNPTANMSNNSNTSVKVTTAPSLFNNTNKSNNIFGQSKLIPSTGAFGAPSSTSSSFATNSSDNFRSTTQSLSLGIQQPITTAGFGTSQTAISMSTSAFATSNISTPAASSTVSPPPAFGTPNSSSTSSGFGTLKSITPDYNPPPPFGFRSSTVSAFGAQNPNTSTTFNTTTPAFATGGTITTTTASQSFGAAPSSTSTFGTLRSFGNSNAPPPAFGSSVNTGFSSGFGGTNSTNSSTPFGNQPSSTPAFGSTNTPTPSFGTPSTNNVSAGSSGSAFSFGNTPMNQSQQQTSPFTFGDVNKNNNNGNNNNTNNNNNNNNATGAGTPFQFGAAPTPQPGGFNFTGGSPAPSFGGSSAGSSGVGGNSGGMFSIGSGSTAPRSRSARTRRQQR